jgi:hypothetical protein
VSEVKNQDLPVKLFRLEANQDQNQRAMMVVRTREVMVEQNTMFRMIVRRLNSSALSAASAK